MKVENERIELENGVEIWENSEDDRIEIADKYSETVFFIPTKDLLNLMPHFQNFLNTGKLE